MFLLWQRISILRLVYCFLFYPYIFLIRILLIFKISLPPFHYWFWNIIFIWKWKTFNLFIVTHKYSPLVVLLNYIRISEYYFLLFTPLIIFISLWYFFSLKSLLFSILTIDFIWVIFSWFLFFKLLCFYFIILAVFIVFMINIIKDTHYYIFYRKIEILLLIIIIFGLPPFFSFRVKWLICSHIRLFYTIFIIRFLLLNLYFYWGIFYLNIVNNNFINNKVSLKIYIILILNTSWLYLC